MKYRDLSDQDKTELESALNYMKMEELKKFCEKHSLSVSGKKGPLIQRILHYLKTNERIDEPEIPAISRAPKGAISELKPGALILHGLYKNDPRTKAFMKTLVGERFHFTAFGQDWIQERQLAGNPPTYRDFASFWEEEMKNRQNPDYKANPKAEWAYLNFAQRYKAEHGNERDVGSAWNKLRAEKAEWAEKILSSLDVEL